MSDYFAKFKEKISEKDYFSKGNRNQNLIAVARYAKIYELSESEYESFVKSEWGVDFDPTDANTMKRAWEKVQRDGSIKTMSDFKNEKEEDSINLIRYMQKEEEKSNEMSRSLLQNAAFENIVSKLEKEIDIKEFLNKNKSNWPTDSSLLLEFFKYDDLVWVSDSPMSMNVENEIKDIDTFALEKKPLAIYNYFVINPMKDNKKRSDDNIKKYRYMLLECDIIDKKTQLLLFIDMIRAGVPIKSLTFTGNKSIHALLKVNGIDTKEEWDEFSNEVFKNLNSLNHFDNSKETLFDEKCKNPSRLSRIPFGVRKIETEDEFGEKTFKKTIQNLLYLQTDKSNLQGDTLESIKNWCRKFKKDEEKSDEVDEIKEDELLSLFKGKRVHDIWIDETGDIHTLMRNPHTNENGKIIWTYENVVWKSEKSFYSFCQQELEETWKCRISIKDLKLMKIRYKVAEKIPYIGSESRIKKNYVNAFIPGWLGEIINDESISGELNEPLKMFLDNIFGCQTKEREWTLQWMREFMHTFKVMTAPVFWEVPGTGKTMLAKAFGEAIGDWIKTPPKKDDIQFNAWQDHTVIIFEESSSGSKRDGKDLGDLLKDWITETQKTIEAKGKDPVKKTIKSCFIFNANISDNVAPVFIEDKDRRYTVIRNEDAVNLRDLWNDEDFLKWDDGTYPKMLMKWIYNLPKNNKIDVRKGLDNAWKEEVKEIGKTNVEVAIEEIVSEHRGFMTNANLLEVLQKEYGLKCTTRATGNILKKLGYESKCRKMTCLGSPQVVRGYEFIDNEVEDDQKNSIEEI